jgi:tellurite methyltransferase
LATIRHESDRERWDRKYSAGEGPTHFGPNPLLTENRGLLAAGRALDAACGFGGSALYLAEVGYRVDAVDASSVGLGHAQAEAQRRGLDIHFVQADLDHWQVPAAHYDLITVFFYLNREFVGRAAAGLRPGGLLFQANRNIHFLEERPDFNPDYLLDPGELRRLALGAGLEVLFYCDGTPEEVHLTQIIARRRP